MTAFSNSSGAAGMGVVYRAEDVRLGRLTDTEPAWPPGSTVYPAAMLALARAQAAAGDTAAAKPSYQRFLEFWKRADVNLTGLFAAQPELAALR